MINEDALRSIEKLHEMKAAGILSEEEFASAKQELLHGKGKVKRGPELSVPEQQGEPAMEEHLQWALLPLRRYAQFDGRSSRREFWMFHLMIAVVLIVLYAIGTTGPINAAFSLLSASIGIMGVIIPSVAVQVRRFHDQGKSGWFALLNLIPFAWIIILIFMALPGTEGENEYGPDPLL